MMRVYVAGPYSSDPAAGVAAAIAAADELLSAGCAPYVPHLTHFWNQLYPRPWEDWIALDLAWLEKCDALLRLPGASRGADRETEHARLCMIPIYGSVAEISAAAGDGDVLWI